MEQNQSGVDRDRLKDVQSWRRSRSDRMVAGVCGGIGRALNIDPVLVRVVMGVLIVSGPGLVFYLAAWMLMPDEGSDRSPAQGLLGDRVRPDHPWLWPVVIGVCVFVAIALMSSFDFGRLVPGPLVVLGLLWLFVFRRKGNRCGGPQWSGPGTAVGADRVQDVSPQPGTPQPGTPSGSAPTGTPDPGTSRPGAFQTGPPAPPAGPSSSAAQRPQDRTVEPVQPVWTEDDPLGLYVDEPAAPAATPPAQPPAKGVRGVKSAIVVLTGLALAIAYLAQAPTPMVLAIGLATLGAGMLIGGFLGRTLALLPLGILLAVGVAVSTVFPSIPRDFADTNYVATPSRPITATNMTHTFDAGSVHLDLTKATFEPGAKVVVDGGLGDVVIKLPPNVDASGTLSAKGGEVVGFDERRSGHEATLSVSDLGVDNVQGPESVALDVRLDFGSVKVERG